jgi:hypothetical protein
MPASEVGSRGVGSSESTAATFDDRETSNDGDDRAIGVSGVSAIALVPTSVTPVNHGRMEAATYTPSLTTPTSLDER